MGDGLEDRGPVGSIVRFTIGLINGHKHPRKVKKLSDEFRNLCCFVRVYYVAILLERQKLEFK